MSEITYHTNLDQSVKVYLGGLRVGMIKAVEGGWSYFPKNFKSSGEVFQTVAAVKRDIEG